MSTTAADIGWKDIFPEPFVALLLGARGEGKTALAHRMLEVFGDNGRDVYIMGFPEDKQHLLPDEVEVLPPDTHRSEWPENSIVLIHEAHHLLHARRSMDAENLNLDELVTVSRHKDSNIIYDTQQSQRLDKNAVAAVDGICVRWPALMQEEFERRAVRPIIEDARDTLSKYVTIHDEADFTFVERDEDDDGVEKLKKHVYIHADRFRGEYPNEIDLASWWSEDISKAYSGTAEGTPQEVKSLDDVREDMADPDEVGDKDPSEVLEMLGQATDSGSGGGGDQQETPDTTPDPEPEPEPEPEPATDDVPASRGNVTADDFTGPVDAVEGDDGETYFITSGGPRAEGDGPFIENAGVDYIERMADAGNRVTQNPFEDPIVEVVFPRSSIPEVRKLVDEWDINPQGPTSRVSPPSFAEERPRVGEGLAAFHFKLGPDSEELRSSGYDVASIIEGLQQSNEPYLVTLSPAAEAQVEDMSVFEA
jgi:hypothetical protein